MSSERLRQPHLRTCSAEGELPGELDNERGEVEGSRPQRGVVETAFLIGIVADSLWSWALARLVASRRSRSRSLIAVALELCPRTLR